MSQESLFERFTKISKSLRGSQTILKLFQFSLMLIGSIICSEKLSKICFKYSRLILDSRLTFCCLLMFKRTPDFIKLYLNKNEKYRLNKLFCISSNILCSLFTFLALSVRFEMIKTTKTKKFFVCKTSDFFWFCMGLSGALFSHKQLQEIQIKEKVEEEKVKKLKESIIANCCEMILAGSCMGLDKLILKKSIHKSFIGASGIISALITLKHL